MLTQWQKWDVKKGKIGGEGGGDGGVGDRVRKFTSGWGVNRKSGRSGVGKMEKGVRSPRSCKERQDRVGQERSRK